MRRRLLALLTLACCSLLLANITRAAGWTATITQLDLFAGAAQHAVYLAPDGTRFVYFSERNICLYSIAGEKVGCADFPKDLILDAESGRWSPDGKKFAFSEDFLDTFRDSDIWLYDADTNTLTDATPMANRDVSLMSNDPDLMHASDTTPVWTADSQSIYFVRYVYHSIGDASSVFYKLNVADSSTERIAPVETTFPMATYGFALSPDGKQIAYNVDTRGTEKDGTWLLDLATKQATFAAAPIGKSLPWTYQYSPDGTQILVVGIDTQANMTPRPPENSAIYTLPTAGGNRQQLNSDTYVYAAGWGRDGTTLAYTTYDNEHPEKQGLYVTIAPGEAGDLILPGRFVEPSPVGRVPLFWSANNTILVSTGPDFKLAVVQLSQN